MTDGRPATGEAPRILLVDDNAEVLLRAGATLAPEFQIVGALRSGLAALEVVRRLHPHLVVMDISMPGVCGLDVAAELSAWELAAGVVFLTIHDDEELVRAASRVAAGYVLKPRLALDLRPAVRCVLGGGRFASPQIPAHLW